MLNLYFSGCPSRDPGILGDRLLLELTAVTRPIPPKIDSRLLLFCEESCSICEDDLDDQTEW
jgi:hypothetical protein